MMQIGPENRKPSIEPGMIAALRELQEAGEPDFLADLIDIYLEEIPTRLSAIGKAIAARDMRTVALICHRMKGSSANLGAERLSQLCKDLEIKAATDQIAAIPTAWAKVQDEFENARRELAAIPGDPRKREG
jgi:HPt (histidine-containing phosphotransfer) domain-containing protein